MKEKEIISVKTFLQELYETFNTISNDIKSKFLINMDMDFLDYLIKITEVNKLFQESLELHIKICDEIINFNIDDSNCNYLLDQIKIYEDDYSNFEEYSKKIILIILETLTPGTERINESFEEIKGESEIEAHRRWLKFVLRMQNIAFFLGKVAKLPLLCFEARINLLNLANEFYSYSKEATYNGKEYSITFGWYNNGEKYSLDAESQKTISLKQQQNNKYINIINNEKNNYYSNKNRLIEYKEKCQDIYTKIYWKNNPEKFNELQLTLKDLLNSEKKINDKFAKRIEILENKKKNIIANKKEKELCKKSLSIFKLKERALIKKEIDYSSKRN